MRNRIKNWQRLVSHKTWLRQVLDRSLRAQLHLKMRKKNLSGTELERSEPSGVRKRLKKVIICQTILISYLVQVIY